jgi:nitrogen-specific signal transduction histidine kinase
MQGKADEMNIPLRVDSTESLPLVEADRDKIKQVILNLMVTLINSRFGERTYPATRS